MKKPRNPRKAKGSRRAGKRLVATPISLPKWDPTLPERAQQSWLRVSEEEKEAAIKDATAFLSDETTFKYRGERASPTQNLAWPRTGAFYDDGSPIEPVPEAIKRAQALTAMFMASDVPMTVQSMAHILAILGPILEPEKIQ